MTYIVTRLRSGPHYTPLQLEAADEIERLRAIIDEIAQAEVEGRADAKHHDRRSK